VVSVGLDVRKFTAMVMKFEPWEADAAGSWDRNIYIYISMFGYSISRRTRKMSLNCRVLQKDTRKSQIVYLFRKDDYTFWMVSSTALWIPSDVYVLVVV